MNWLKSDISMACSQASFTLVKMIIIQKIFDTINCIFYDFVMG